MAKPKYRLHVYKDAEYKHRWRLIALNGNIIADSGQGYASRDSCIKACRKLTKIAAEAVIE